MKASSLLYRPSDRLATLDSYLAWVTRWYVIMGATLVFVLGAKWFLIGVAASATPFWDEWDAIADLLLTPYLKGQLSLHDLMVTQNEHRIFLGRILTLGVVEVSGNWNVILQMTVNAVIHVGFLASLIWTLRKCGPTRMPALIAFLLLALYAIPTDLENTLWGFQAPFYFVSFFSLTALILFIEAAAFDRRWCLAILCSVLSLLSMAGGILAVVAAGVVIAVQMLLRVRPRSGREIAGLGLMIAMALAMLAVTPSGEVSLRAKGLVSFILAFVRAAGWPYYLPLVAPLIANAPVLALAYVTWRRTPAIGAPSWRVIALAAWIGISCAGIAYSRAIAPIGSRYVDLFGILILANFCALYLLVRDSSRRTVLPAIWVALSIGSLIFAESRMIPQQVAIDPARVMSRDQAVKSFIRTRDPRVLDRPLLFIPYPDHRRLATILARPEVIGILPASFGAPAALQAEMSSRLALHGGLRLSPELVQRGAKLAGTILMTLAGTILALAWALTRRTQPAASTEPGRSTSPPGVNVAPCV